jgi:hypothetical protein
MSIFNRSKDRKLVANLKTEVNSLRSDIKRHRFDTQNYIDALTLESISSKYAYNNFREYAGACQAVSDKYENRADWGNALAANIIDFRAAVTVSSGPQYKPAAKAAIKQKDEDGKSVAGGENIRGRNGEANPQTKLPIQKGDSAGDIEAGAEREIEFCRDFFDANDLNHEAPQELGREAEIEGRVSVTLDWDDKKKQAIVKHLPWITYKYEEIPSKINPKAIDKITWPANTALKIEAGSAEGDLLVCRRFSGRSSSKYPVTKMMRSLTQVEAIDQAFRDWREINRLYAAPVPDFEFTTADEADDFRQEFAGAVNWKIKKALIHSGKFSYKGPDMGGITSLENEIKRLACFISGTTGYPLQFLLPDMLANRSTSENIMESALVHTASERAIWTGFYEELISKAMILWTKKTGKTALDPTKIAITISLMTKDQWDRLVGFWLPAFEKDLVTREAVLPQIPDFNVREELDRREGADNSEVARVTAELDRLEREEQLRGNQNPQQPPASGQFKAKEGEEE